MSVNSLTVNGINEVSNFVYEDQQGDMIRPPFLLLKQGMAYFERRNQ
jgi:hypothetical protein